MMPADMGTETLTIDFDGDATNSWGLWYKRTTDSPWTSVNHVTSSAGAATGTTMTFSHDGSMEGNLGGGIYAIFDAATAGAHPPATGVSGLTASLAPDARIDFSWGYSDDSLLSNADTVRVYWCAWADANTPCDPLYGTQLPGMSPATMSWQHNGVDATKYTIRVQTENGNTDVVTGEMLTGGLAEITVTADGSVSPAPTIEADVPTVEDNEITFTWTATSTGDVSSWVLCWAGTQDSVENDFSSLLGNSCATTVDTTTSITVTEQDICGGSCNAQIYFAIGAKDSVGNVYSPDGASHLSYVDFTGGVTDPGIIDDGGSDEIPQISINQTSQIETVELGSTIQLSFEVINGGSNPILVLVDADGDWSATATGEDGTSVFSVPAFSEEKFSVAVEIPSDVEWGEEGEITVSAKPLSEDELYPAEYTALKLITISTHFDSDSDNIPDVRDDCPVEAGSSTYPDTGCPDDDGDGWSNTYDAFPSNAGEWVDSDLDNVGDNSDQCPNTEPDESVDATGCKIEESDILMYTAVGAGGITGATLLFFLLPRMMRNMNADESKDRMKWEDEVWQEPQGMPEGPPIEQVMAPDPGLTGMTQQDGYEYLEWPAASGDWWYRVGAGMDWAKWEK
jgi:hypothetical protein